MKRTHSYLSLRRISGTLSSVACGAALLATSVVLPLSAQAQDKDPAPAPPSKALLAPPPPAPSVPPPGEPVLTPAEGGVVGSVTFGAPSAAPMAKYSIGVSLREIDPALRAQAGLEEGKGVVIVAVRDAGPAGKAGVKLYDILVSANDHDIANTFTLSRILNSCEGKEIKLVVVRAGKKEEIKVSPVETPVASLRPAGVGEERKAIVINVDPNMTHAQVREMIEKAQGNPVVLRTIGPGVVVPPEVELKDLPDGASIKILRNPGEPARVVIHQGDQTWEATEADVDRLPEKFRKIARGLFTRLGKVAVQVDGPASIGVVRGQAVLERAVGVAEAAAEVGRAAPDVVQGLGETPVERRLEAMDRRIERLIQEVRSLRQAARGEVPAKAAPVAPPAPPVVTPPGAETVPTPVPVPAADPATPDNALAPPPGAQIVPGTPGE